MTFDPPHELNGHALDETTAEKPGLDESEPDEIKAGSDTSGSPDEIVYIKGARFWLICVAIAIIMFLVNLEVPVVITALVSITSDLQGFENVAWVVASYLLGYVGLFKPAFVLYTMGSPLALGIIVICAKFSDIFGRKIVFVLSIAIFIIFSAACSAAQTLTQLSVIALASRPSKHANLEVASFSELFKASAAADPGLSLRSSSPNSSRRKIIRTLPALLITLYVIPKDFPYHNQPSYKRNTFRDLVSKSTLDRVDVPGTVLILFATLALTAAFEEADKRFPWRNFILLGGPTVIFPPVYLLILGSTLQVLGFALIATLPSTLEIPSRIYGFQILAGWGCGINFSLLFILIPVVNEKCDNAVGLGAGSQFRFIGGSIVLSISTSLFNSYVRPRLESQLGISDPDALIQILPTLAPPVQDTVRHILATGYSRQIIVLAVSAGLQIPATLLMWKKKQLKL
ncbi:hypothetical protein CHU98_g7291 [Xylaria longipes]|nr:hypothetical protein CHU98_g7291 [Xylaria longipes]